MNGINKILFSIFSLLILSCQDPRQGTVETNSLAEEALESEASEPFIQTQFSGNTYPIIFEAAFQNGTRARQGSSYYSFELYDVGKIKSETGKIIACDPIVMRDGIAFEKKFPVGEFPVQLALAQTKTDSRVAFCRILFSDKPVAKWEFALQPGQEKIELGDTNFYCFGVDAAMGIFIDESANKDFIIKDKATWEYVFIAKSKGVESKGYMYNFEGHNLAVFSTGYGDGCYATYVGLDDKGEVCRLLCDFAFVQWWVSGKKGNIL